MKKAIILSGSQASGKTHTAEAIANFYSDNTIGRFEPKLYSKLMKTGLSYMKLMIIDECLGLSDITLFEPLRRRNPNCSFVFITQSKIMNSDIDPIKYHLIQCNWKWSKFWDIKPVIMDEYSEDRISDVQIEKLKQIYDDTNRYLIKVKVGYFERINPEFENLSSIEKELFARKEFSNLLSQLKTHEIDRLPDGMKVRRRNADDEFSFTAFIEADATLTGLTGEIYKGDGFTKQQGSRSID